MIKIVRIFLTSLILLVILMLLGSFIWSLNFNGSCGFLSDPCSYSGHFWDNLTFVSIIAIWFLPVFILAEIIIEFVIKKFNNRMVWFYLFNLLVLAGSLIVLVIDPFQFF